MDMYAMIALYENGELDHDDEIGLFQVLYDTGTINHLQGSYGRHMQYLIDMGYIRT